MNPLAGRSIERVSRDGKRRRAIVLGLALILAPIALALFLTSPWMARRNAEVVMERLLGQEIRFSRVESMWWSGVVAHEGRSAGEPPIALPRCEIRFDRLPLLIGMRKVAHVALVDPAITLFTMPDSQGVLHALASGDHPASVEVTGGVLEWSGQGALESAGVKDVNFTVKKNQAGQSAIQCRFHAAADVVASAPVEIEFAHEGVLSPKKGAYKAESLNVRFWQRGKQVGRIRLDRPAHLSWNAQSEFVQGPPTEISIRMNELEMPWPLRMPGSSERLSSGTLSCDVTASVGGGGRLIDMAGTVELGHARREAGNPGAGMWNDFAIRADLPTQKLLSYSLNSRLLQQRRSRGKVRLRGAWMAETQGREGTLSVEDVDLAFLQSFLDLPGAVADEGILSLEHAWNYNREFNRLTATGELSVQNLVLRSQDQAAGPLELRVASNLAFDHGRLRGAWASNRLARIETFSGGQPGDAFDISVDLSRADPGKLNRIVVQARQITLKQYGVFLDGMPQALSSRGRDVLRSAAREQTPPFAFEAAVDRLMLGDRPFLNAKVDGAYTQGRVMVTTATAALERGAASASGEWRVKEPGRPFEMRGALRDVALEELAGALGLKTDMGGVADATMALRGEGVGGSWRHSLAGSLKFAVEDPRLTHLALFEPLNALPWVQAADPQWSALWGQAKVKGLGIDSATVALRSHNLQVDARGNASAGMQAYEWDCHVAFDASLARSEMMSSSAPLIRDSRGWLHLPALVRVACAQGKRPSLQIVLEESGISGSLK